MHDDHRTRSVTAIDAKARILALLDEVDVDPRKDAHRRCLCHHDASGTTSGR